LWAEEKNRKKGKEDEIGNKERKVTRDLRSTYKGKGNNLRE
jgi:hypothetical protein